MSFCFSSSQKFCVERFQKLDLFHGFYGKPYDYYNNELTSSLDIPLHEDIMVPCQVHGDQIIDLRRDSWNEQCEADAIVMSTDQRGIIGVKTADCIPILIYSRDMIGVIHAGWRGVALNITGKVLELFSEQKDVLCIIGPHAQTYEVKADVIDAMKGDAVYEKCRDESFILNLKETLFLKTKKFTNVSFFSSSRCTIKSSFFHSYRRDGVLRGSNLSVIASPLCFVT